MDSISIRAAVYLSVCLSLWTAVSLGQRLSSSPPEDGYDPLDPVPRSLVEALESLLETPDNSIALSVEKKASVIPRCDVGERCAMKHGPRIGRLCDCLRGTACNTFFLRCY